MRKRVAMLSAAAILALAGAGAALSADPNEPGTPGSPNCQGQEIAFLNGLFGAMGLHGLDEIASALGFASVKDFQEANKAFCAGAGPRAKAPGPTQEERRGRRPGSALPPVSVREPRTDLAVERGRALGDRMPREVPDHAGPPGRAHRRRA